MDILKYILFGAEFCSSAALTFFAVTAWFQLRKLKGEIQRLNLMQLAGHIKDNIDEIAKMKKTLNRLIEEDRYEDAKELAANMEKMQHSTAAALNFLKEAAGDEMEVIVTKVPAKGNEE